MKVWRRLRANTNLLTLLALGSALLAAGCAARRMSQDYIFDVTGVVQTEDGAPVQDAEVILEINGTVYEGVTPVTTVKHLTDSTGGFIFMYISGESGMKYTLTVHKAAFEPQTVSGSAPPTGNHVIRLKSAGGNG